MWSWFFTPLWSRKDALPGQGRANDDSGDTSVSVKFDFYYFSFSISPVSYKNSCFISKDIQADAVYVSKVSLQFHGYFFNCFSFSSMWSALGARHSLGRSVFLTQELLTLVCCQTDGVALTIVQKQKYRIAEIAMHLWKLSSQIPLFKQGHQGLLVQDCLIGFRASSKVETA